MLRPIDQGRHLFVGYALIGAATFALDIALLALLRSETRLPLALDVSIAYVTAFALNFVLNRRFNFRSHAPVAGEALRYCVVVVADFALTLGITTGLSAIGLDFRVARLIAAGCVGAATYLGCRWWVFKAPEPVVPPTAARVGSL